MIKLGIECVKTELKVKSDKNQRWFEDRLKITLHDQGIWLKQVQLEIVDKDDNKKNKTK